MQESTSFDNEAPSYLLKLSDALRPLGDPKAIRNEATRLPREHLKCDRVLYCEAVEAGAAVHVTAEDVAEGIYSMLGQTFIFSVIDEEVGVVISRGEPFLETNVQANDRNTPEQKAIFASLDSQAFAIMPLVKDNALVAALLAYTSIPHDWTVKECYVLSETGERT